MKDEIKEILDNKLYFDLEEEDYIKIKDYITNLQKEKDKYKNVIDRIKEYAKANKIIEIIAFLEAEEVE